MTSPELADNLIHRVNVGDSLTRTAARYPGRTAVVDGDRRFGYRELNGWVNRVAHGLVQRGYRRGDALALASGNSIEFLVVYYACAKLGVVCVPINLGWRPDEVRYVLEHSESRGIVVETQLLATFDDAVADVPSVRDVVVAPGTGGAAGDRTTLDEIATGDADVEPEHFVADRDPISYLYTSGTTSAPKGVVGNHTAIYLESMTMTGYLKNPEATEAVFAHGWLHSGDAGYVDADGVLWFTDRCKDVIKTGGENVERHYAPEAQ